MSKRRNKSRFTKTDVNTICEMQRKIDAYEDFIVGICGLIQHRGKERFLSILKGTPMDDLMNIAWSIYMEQARELPDACSEKTKGA